MRKIVITDKREMAKMCEAMGMKNPSSCYRALNFETHSLFSSLIRCHAMNQLRSSRFLHN